MATSGGLQCLNFGGGCGKRLPSPSIVILVQVIDFLAYLFSYLVHFFASKRTAGSDFLELESFLILKHSYLFIHSPPIIAYSRLRIFHYAVLLLGEAFVSCSRELALSGASSQSLSVTPHISFCYSTIYL